MSKINNRKELDQEITRLRKLIQDKETDIREGLRGLKDYVSPSHVFSDTYEKITGEAPQKNAKGFAGILKTGLSLLLGKVVLKAEEKAEQHVYDAVDTAFEKFREFIERKFNRSKNENSPADGEEEV
jgi:hypothetical protein